jgi:CBS domain containing-hemolysin-like protein
VRLLLEEGTEAGVFVEAQQDLVEHVFRLADRQVDEIMTPRPTIVWLDVDAPPEENARRMADSPHAQVPVCRGDLDHVLGIVSLKAMWAQVVRGLRAQAGWPHVSILSRYAFPSIGGSFTDFLQRRHTAATCGSYDRLKDPMESRAGGHWG